MRLDPHTRRRHPFGRVASALVHLGTTLAIAQAVVLVFAWGSAPLWADLAAGIAPSLVLMALGVGVGGGAIWLAWTTLMRWRARQVSILGRLYGAALVFMLLGALEPVSDVPGTLLLLWPAGVLLALAAFIARPAILVAEREGRGGLER